MIFSKKTFFTTEIDKNLFLLMKDYTFASQKMK